MKFLYRFWPLLGFIVLIVIFWRGLFLHPQELPSARIGKPFPSFNLPLLNAKSGDVFQKSEFYGKISLVNVWSSWCMACKEEQSFLLHLADNGVNIYGFNYKDDANNASSWLQVWGNPYQKILQDASGMAALELGVYGSPETFIIDKQAIIRYRYAGILNQKVWDEQFMPLIKELESQK